MKELISRRAVGLVVLITLLAACSGPGQRSFNLNGIWGGVFTAGSTDFAVFAVDVSTQVRGSAGTVSGVGLVRNSGVDIYVNVAGQTQPTSVSIRLVDPANDYLQLAGTVQGQVIRGTWTYPAQGASGNFRMAHEENIHLLAVADTASSVLTLQELVAALAQYDGRE